MKSGQAATLTPQEITTLFEKIAVNRHPEKNAAIMQISFKLALRVQEISLLQIKEVARLNATGTDFTLLKTMALPAAYTKGADAMKRSRTQYQRKTVSFTTEQFNKVIEQVVRIVQLGGDVNPVDLYPPERQHKGKSRDLPMVDQDLRDALETHLYKRLEKGPLRPSDPLFVTQKGGTYSPNTLQDHMALMLREWAGVEKASSHSGRRTVITDIIHTQGKSVKIAQKVAGHTDPSTTLIYAEAPAESIAEALRSLKKDE